MKTNTAKKVASKYATKMKPAATRIMKKSTNSLLSTASKALKAEVQAATKGLAADGLTRAVQKYSERIKTPSGTLGRNLNFNQMQLIDTSAVGGTTESESLFSYRPKKTPKTSDTIYYTAVRNKKLDLANDLDRTFVADRNLALLEPPLNDVLQSDDSYTNFSIRNEFDRMLLARANDQTANVEMLKSTLTANFHSLASTMILNAPSEGAIVEIYDLQPRFSLGPGTYVSEGRANDHLSPQWCWQEGVSNTASIETMDDLGFRIPGIEPTISPTFRRTWNILKKTTVRMASNSVHRHRSIFNINKSVTYDEMAQASPSGGTTSWLPTTMVVSRGYPTSSNLAESVTVTCQQESSLKYSSRLAKSTNVIVYNNNT